MISWLLLVADIYSAIKEAVLLAISTAGAAIGLLQPTYDIISVRNKLSDGTLVIGSRVKIQGRFSEFIPFVDMSILLFSKLINSINRSPEARKYIENSMYQTGARLVHTCRLSQIDGFWSAALFFPEEKDVSSPCALPIFFDNSASELLNAKNGDIVELVVKISPIPSSLSKLLHPEPIYVLKRKDGTPIPIGLLVESVRNISTAKEPMFANIWLLGHYEPMYNNMCAIIKSYISYQVTKNNKLLHCRGPVFGYVGSSEEIKSGKSIPDLLFPKEQMQQCFFFENIGGCFFRIGKGHVDIKDSSFEFNKKLLFAPLQYPDYIYGHISKQFSKSLEKIGDRKLVLDFQFDQRAQYNPQDIPFKSLINEVQECKGVTA